MPTVDLSQLPQPAVIESLDFEVILADVKNLIINAFPPDFRAAVTAALKFESEPLNIIAQVVAWRELLLRQRINDGAAACMLSHSVSTDLDNIAANMDTERLVITPATDTTDAVIESDTALRMRAQAAFDGLSVAGPSGAYEYFAKSASGKVADAKATSPSPAVVVLSVLSIDGDGTASPDLLATVTSALSAEDRRPVADRLTVQSAEIVSYSINARLFFYPGPESEPIQNAAHDALTSWLALQGRIGRDVARSAIMAALHVQGVQRVELTEPATDIVISDTQAARCIAVTLEKGGTDE
ncbi:baseplate assembly protein [Salmonella enterica subsp. enterica serovar Muenchen]|uniref:Baseplate assembly protein n=1 Tax=Salmonella enterica subsp. enterica serovar Rough O:d:1,7 TaxID=1974323 RepID=A0A974QG89_SALET|nr:baseplate J/gp47 family protein [Salmonella enterica]EAA6844856.1 baseplate assembly protein [Salmonella enterica subsp. enterica serovar Pensacola]EAW1193779.1 baseplate assembly protein [Salmonella enterica subsp. enterica]EBU8845870.1 baseplate assembly protein [Salmonella enterica subsp. enterica serovar Muenchen]EAW9008958.1 baseplate assembly protein [Salmonella enterica]EAY5639841.1 baseplate assembly protein [Salmonella enterica]